MARITIVPSSQTFIREFGKNVRRERTKRGISQLKLAEKVDLNIRNVQRIEAGQITSLLTTAKRIKDALDCPWESLLGK